jgi:hypothetical protein
VRLEQSSALLVFLIPACDFPVIHLFTMVVLQVYLMLLEQLLASSVASTIRIVRLLRITRSARIMRFFSIFRNLCVSKPDIYAEDEAATALEARRVFRFHFTCGASLF